MQGVLRALAILGVTTSLIVTLGTLSLGWKIRLTAQRQLENLAAAAVVQQHFSGQGCEFLGRERGGTDAEAKGAARTTRSIRIGHIHSLSADTAVVSSCRTYATKDGTHLEVSATIPFGFKSFKMPLKIEAHAFAKVSTAAQIAQLVTSYPEWDPAPPAVERATPLVPRS